MKLTADQRSDLYDILRGALVGEGYYRSTLSGDDATELISELGPVIEGWIEDACSQTMSDVMDARPAYCPNCGAEFEHCSVCGTTIKQGETK